MANTSLVSKVKYLSAPPRAVHARVAPPVLLAPSAVATHETGLQEQMEQGEHEVWLLRAQPYAAQMEILLCRLAKRRSKEGMRCGSCERNPRWCR